MKRLLRIGLPFLTLTAFTGCGPVDPMELSDSSEPSDSSVSDVRGQFDIGCSPPTNAGSYCASGSPIQEVTMEGGCTSAHYVYYCTRPTGGCTLWTCTSDSPANTGTETCSHFLARKGCF